MQLQGVVYRLHLNSQQHRNRNTVHTRQSLVHMMPQRWTYRNLGEGGRMQSGHRHTHRLFWACGGRPSRGDGEGVGQGQPPKRSQITHVMHPHLCLFFQKLHEHYPTFTRFPEPGPLYTLDWNQSWVTPLHITGPGGSSNKRPQACPTRSVIAMPAPRAPFEGIIPRTAQLLPSPKMAPKGSKDKQ